MPADSENDGRPVALIIEDDQDTVDLLEVVLTQAGFSVISADNATDGVALAREHAPVLMTVDVNMPGMSGLEATQRIREFSSAYIVIISSRAHESDILAGFDAGADDYVPKPIRPVELRARLAAVARRPVTEIVGAVGTAQQGWAPAAEDAARSELLRQVAAGAPVGVAVADEDEDEDGQDGREGMLDIGMRFVGGWVEFRGLRINPARGIVVVDDRLVDLPQEQVDLLEVLMYIGSRSISARQLALRVRDQSEESATTTHRQDERWIEALMTGLRAQVKDDGPRPRWIQVLPNNRYRLVRPTEDVLVSDDAPA